MGIFSTVSADLITCWSRTGTTTYGGVDEIATSQQRKDSLEKSSVSSQDLKDKLEDVIEKLRKRVPHSDISDYLKVKDRSQFMVREQILAQPARIAEFYRSALATAADERYSTAETAVPDLLLAVPIQSYHFTAPSSTGCRAVDSCVNRFLVR